MGIEQLSQVAHQFRSEQKHKSPEQTSGRYVVLKQDKKGGDTWVISEKHNHHSALKTLKVMEKELSSTNLTTVDRQSLRDIRHLAKQIRAGYVDKYAKTDSNFLDGIRMIMGKKSELEKVEELCTSIEGKINGTMGHKPKEGLTHIGAGKFPLVKEFQGLKERFERDLEKADPIDRALLVKEFLINLHDKFDRRVEHFITNMNHLDYDEKVNAKKELDYLMKEIQNHKPISRGARIGKGAHLILAGPTEKDKVKGSYAKFYKAYKKSNEEELPENKVARAAYKKGMKGAGAVSDAMEAAAEGVMDIAAGAAKDAAKAFKKVFR